MTSTSSPFLDLPLEIRLEIYNQLLVIPPLNKLIPIRPSRRLHPSILLTNHQLHDEATPILYSANTFLAHSSLLSSFPRLRLWYPPVKQATVLPRIKRYHIRVRLDCDPGYDVAAVTAAFTGKDELTIEVWQAMFLGAGHGTLRLFEGVRGVKKAKIFGSTAGFEDYAKWLENAIQSDIGSHVPGFVATATPDSQVLARRQE